MYVKDIEDGVCSFYATLHTEYCYSCQRCQILCTVLCIQGPSLFQEGRLFEKPSVLWISQFTTSQSEEAALLTFLDLSTTRVITGKTHSQSPILKTKGVLSKPVILTYLHPPYPNQTSCLVYEFRSKKHLQYLYNSFGVGRFSSWQSWLTQASIFANSQASALNAGVPTAPYSPESNCLYLAYI